MSVSEPISEDPIERIRVLWQDKSVTETSAFPSPSNLAELRLRLLKHSIPNFEQVPLNQIFDSAMDSVRETGPREYQRPADPAKDLKLRVAGVDPAPEDAEVLPTKTEPGPVVVENTALSQVLGQELLNLASSQALSPEARVEALEATALALVNPTQDNVRAVLRALIRGLKV